MRGAGARDEGLLHAAYAACRVRAASDGAAAAVRRAANSERGVIRLALAEAALGKKARHGRARARVTGRITGIELGEEAAPARGHRAAQAGLCRERCGRREQRDEYGALSDES